jgi:hypothetical protein
MDTTWKAGGSNDSLTASTRLLNQKLGTSPAPRRLTPSEIDLLGASKRELAAQAFATPTRASAHATSTNK